MGQVDFWGPGFPGRWRSDGTEGGALPRALRFLGVAFPGSQGGALGWYRARGGRWRAVFERWIRRL